MNDHAGGDDQIGGHTLEETQALLAPWPHRAPPIQRTEYEQRLARARALMHEHGDDALLITAGSSLRYFTGITWGATERLVAMLLTAQGDPILKFRFGV